MKPYSPRVWRANLCGTHPRWGPRCWFGLYFLLGLRVHRSKFNMIAHNVKMEATEQERQMVEVVRDHKVDATSDFRLLVQRQDGAWDVTLSIAPHDELNTSRGTGATFNDAWDNMTPLWA